MAPTTAERAWGSSVVTENVLGAPCLVYQTRPKHVGSLIDEGRRRGDDLYIAQGSRRVSFRQHQAAVSANRHLFSSMGITKGDSVLILGSNSVELVTAFWAVVQCGAIAALGNAWWSADEARHAIAMIKPSVIVCDDRRRALVPASERVLSYDDLRNLAPVDDPVAEIPVGEDDPAVVIFTSGTTGHAKGVCLSHRSVLSALQNLLVITRRLPPYDGPTSRSMLSLPLFHVGGLQLVLTAMTTGGALVFTEGRFDPRNVVELLRRERVLVWSTVPTMVSRVLDYLDASGEELPDLRTIGMGGSAVSEELRARVRRSLPAARRGVGVTWGLTESGGVVTTAAGADLEAHPDSVGRLLPTSRVKSDAVSGELLVNSPSVMLGYWGLPDAEVIDADRWLRTGDIGHIDDDGFVYVTGRAKDIIIRGGENVAAARVEAEIASDPRVLEVAVVGLPHGELGEEVGAVVCLRTPESASPSDLTNQIRANLAYFELPSKWWIRQEPLPRNATGKVVKPALIRAWLEFLALTQDGR
jgi:long-chain acyl-CoA synthetase